MVDVVKKPQYVDVDYKMHRRLIDEKLNSCHGMVCRSKGSEAIAMVVKLDFSYGLKDLLEALLNDAVEDAWDTKRSHFTVIFFDKLSSDFLGAVVFQSALDFTRSCSERCSMSLMVNPSVPGVFDPLLDFIVR